jgi:sirohydrochlorin cobaltochelatase
MVVSALPAQAEISKDRPAIVLTAFGTSTKAEITYGVLERRVREEFPDCEVRWAFTSEVIREKVNARRAAEGRPERLLSLDQALTNLKAEGWKKVVVQPLHVFPGEEYDEALNIARNFNGLTIEFGEALLERWESMYAVADALSREFLPPEAGVNVLVAHGTPTTNSPANIGYLGLDRYLRRKWPNAFLGGVDGVVTREDALGDAKKSAVKRVRFLPFMYVAGDHIMNDIMGDAGGEEGPSWKAEMEKAGFAVEISTLDVDGKPFFKGLGFRPEVNDVFMGSIRRTLAKL